MPTPKIPQEIVELVMAQERGSYQYGLLTGQQCWSGADLQGRAREYGSRYAESRRNLLRRIQSRLIDNDWDCRIGPPPGEKYHDLILVNPKGREIVWE